ncbi:8499_t:CDS:2 [Ambispora leptoticha]|uniref:8499_t:CDS:1 n=1 Tax=Ambispora leptoticha TaxID=144679 RepID=A0A9N8VB01_9GLOM|nr:8499_t:CDS:2 [Ambispora leptoticha]
MGCAATKPDKVNIYIYQLDAISYLFLATEVTNEVVMNHLGVTTVE